MVFLDTTLKYFSLIPGHVRQALSEAKATVPFGYEEEPFFRLYEVMRRRLAERESQRSVSDSTRIRRSRLRLLESRFSTFGTMALLPELGHVKVAEGLEELVILIKLSRPHECASLALRLAEALQIPEVNLALIRRIQRSHGFGQHLDSEDRRYFEGLQHIVESLQHLMARSEKSKGKRRQFIDFDLDPLQQRVELFRALSSCTRNRQIRPLLREFGVNPNRFYVLRQRYMSYGVWGLLDLVQTTKIGEKISPELELQIVEQRLMDPSLSCGRMIERLRLKCSTENVKRIYTRWNLSRFTRAVHLRGVVPMPLPHTEAPMTPKAQIHDSAKTQFPDLIKTANLKLHPGFCKRISALRGHSVCICNPGALIISPFLAQLGVVEAVHTYCPDTFRGALMTNSILVNVLRIIAGFPTVHSFTENSDRSVALAAGLPLNPKRARLYDSLDQLRFSHLQKLRNDAASRARELGIIEGREIAVDYHCDPSDSRFPYDKCLSKAPDKNGDVVFAHRPQILWDSIANTIINIAYCEGRSRATTALYRFCEQNLFKVIAPDAVRELYADSEYTGERQIVYLAVRSMADVTMCLKQNPKIRKWRELTVKQASWAEYGKLYRIASRDFVLPQTGRRFRFVVKQHLETAETRCFGSTHTEYSPEKILDCYHIRWPVETGIRDLIENYFLNKPTGTSPEKIEAHYYSIMLARLTIDYFRSLLPVAQWRTPEEWQCVLSTIRTSIFSSQNCRLGLDESGDFLITYLDGDAQGIKSILADVLRLRKHDGLNSVPWWGGRGVQIRHEDQFDF